MKILEAIDMSVDIQDRVILHKCSFAATTGEFIGIIGPNGSGKTTFLKALRGLLPIASGTVILYGKSMGNLTEKEIARQIAYMQQNVNLGFDYSALEVVMAARYPYLSWWQNEGHIDESIVERAMRFAGVWHLRNKTVNAVSGGERQRIFFAKALAQNTNILLLDEPTAALDLVYADEIFRYCQELCDKGKTVILIVHDLEIAAKFCSRLILLSQGKIVADGMPTEVLTADNLAKAFHLSSTVYADPYFEQLRIFVYPNTVKDAEGYRRGKNSLPKGATTKIYHKREEEETEDYL